MTACTCPRCQSAAAALAGTEPLTPREAEVLTYLSKGCTIEEVAGLLGIKWFTVNDHIKAVYKKRGIDSRGEAGAMAAKMGLV